LNRIFLAGSKDQPRRQKQKYTPFHTYS
jgi:hypothetical protein